MYVPHNDTVCSSPGLQAGGTFYPVRYCAAAAAPLSAPLHSMETWVLLLLRLMLLPFSE